MATIVTMHGTASPSSGEPVEQVVEFCERLLEDAKSGKLKAIATAEVLERNAIAHGLAWGSYTHLNLGTAILRMQHAYAKRVYEEGM